MSGLPSTVAANIASLSPVSSSSVPSSSSPFSPRLSPELLSSPEHHSEVATLRVAVTPQVHDSTPEKVLELPTFLPATEPYLHLGFLCFNNLLNDVYGDVVYWRPNLFKVPLARLENALFLNLRDCIRPLPQALLRNPLP